MPLKCEMWVQFPLNPQLLTLNMGVILKHSVAWQQFKKKMGQANHFLITILIGLDEVGKGNVKKPDTLDVSWNPKDVKSSVLRSRKYVLNSSLAWVVDNFDSYVQNCKRKPCFIENASLSQALDSADRRVNDKFVVLFNKEIDNEDFKLYGALVALGIQWRNVTTHSEANNVLDNQYEDILLQNIDWYRENFCHLDVNKALDNFMAHKCPTLKETTSIIKAFLRFVEIIDSELVKEVVCERYLLDLFDKHYPAKSKSKCMFLNHTIDKQLSEARTFLHSSGFSYENNNNGFEVDENFLKTYIKV